MSMAVLARPKPPKTALSVTVVIRGEHLLVYTLPRLPKRRPVQQHGAQSCHRVFGRHMLSLNRCSCCCWGGAPAGSGTKPLATACAVDMPNHGAGRSSSIGGGTPPPPMPRPSMSCGRNDSIGYCKLVTIIDHIECTADAQTSGMCLQPITCEAADGFWRLQGCTMLTPVGTSAGGEARCAGGSKAPLAMWCPGGSKAPLAIRCACSCAACCCASRKVPLSMDPTRSCNGTFGRRSATVS